MSQLLKLGIRIGRQFPDIDADTIEALWIVSNKDEERTLSFLRAVKAATEESTSFLELIKEMRKTLT